MRAVCWDYCGAPGGAHMVFVFLVLGIPCSGDDLGGLICPFQHSNKSCRIWLGSICAAGIQSSHDLNLVHAVSFVLTFALSEGSPPPNHAVIRGGRQ